LTKARASLTGFDWRQVIEPRASFWALSASIIAGASVPFLTNFVIKSGANLAAHNLVSDYGIALFWVFALATSLMAWPVPRTERLALLGIWGAKIFITLGFMLIYERSYAFLDAFGYFEAANRPTFDWSSTGWGRGTGNVEALAWVHVQLFGDSYHAMKVTFAFLGLMGVYFFYLAASRARGQRSVRLLLILGLTPSILFWSSIVGKDPIAFLSVSLYCLGAVSWAKRNELRWLIVIAAGVMLAALMRLWLVPVLILPMLVLLIDRSRRHLRVPLLLVSGAAVAIAAARSKGSFVSFSVLDLVEYSNYLSTGWAVGGSAQIIAAPFQGIGSLIRFLPLGMFTALFRPLPGEVNNLFGLLSGIENAALLGLLFLTIVRSRLRVFRDPLVLWATSVILAWSTVYAFLSYQNLGTAVRFRLQILPVLLLLLLHLSRRPPKHQQKDNVQP